MAAVLATVALGACTREDRQEVRTEGREMTNQARTEGREMTNQAAAAVDQAALTTKVKAALLADDVVKGTQINVDSNNGTVTLTGTVDTQAQVERAIQVTRTIEGVQNVQNNLVASANAAPGMVPGTQPPGTAPSSTPMPNNTPASK